MSAPREISIASRTIGRAHPPYVICELSANHRGKIEHALELIDAAAATGADAIKIQTYTPDSMTIDHDGPGFQISGGLWDGYTLHDLYSQAHTPYEWHPVLIDRAHQLGITLFSSAFDETGVDLLEALGTPAYKIASFELCHSPLLRRIAATGKPVILSTGLADLGEIAEAVRTLRKGGCRELMLLHCISGYPTPPIEANLNTIPHLTSTFDLPVGLSDHTLNNAVSVAAVALGATAIEKHFTISRANGGPDAAFSLEPSQFASLVADVRTAWQALGRIDYEHAPSEKGNVVFRRSIYAVRDIKGGEPLTLENVRVIRPGYGLAPRHYDEVIGKRARVAIRRGTPIAWTLFE